MHGALARTYACCFGLENADYLWDNYSKGDAHGKIGLEFGFGQLRAITANPHKRRLIVRRNGLSAD